MRIGVLGSGGREHALQWKLAQSPLAETVYCLPGNGGTTNNVPVDPADLEAVAGACDRFGLDLLVVGPEDPLASGIVDRMTDHRTRVFGPTASGARLESSKIWAKAFMERHSIPTASHAEIRSADDAQAAFSRFNGAVLKADGLAAGKGVVVCREAADVPDAWAHLAGLRPSDERFLAEELIHGWELSILVLTDSNAWRAFTPAQDHKPLLEGDRGPNTGGMGAFCPVPACDRELMDRISAEVIDPTLNGLRADGIPYTGFLYFGLMITEDGLRVLEYNVRLGDPEAEILLPALSSDLCEAIVACLDGRLSEAPFVLSDRVFTDVVLASGGYPGTYETGMPIHGLETCSAISDSVVFHAGTRREGNSVVTSGGRVLNVIGSGATLDAAIETAYAAVQRISFDGMVFRRDIGRRNQADLREPS